MNLQEFSALRVGDKIEHPAASTAYGTIVETTPSGVRLVWGEVHDKATRFFFSVTGTSWFGWVKVEDNGAKNDTETQPGVDRGVTKAGG